MKYQTLFKEYVWLVNTIAKCRRITFEEINHRWVETEMSGGVELSRTTFNRHKDAIEDIFGIYIDCDRRDGYKYYIGNASVLERDTIQNWMLSTMTVNNLLTEYKRIHHRVLLEAIPSSEDFLSDLLEAMRRNVKVRFFYQKYSSEPGRDRVVAPYCVKLYRRRWYMLGQNEDEALRLFSLDRIVSLSLTEEHFILPKNFTAEDYFQNSFGVMITGDVAVERVVVRAYGWEPHYLRDLPMHASQCELDSTEEYTDFEYRLAPTSDFVRQLMSRGGLQEVVEPQWLADKLKEMHLYAAKIYDGEK